LSLKRAEAVRELIRLAGIDVRDVPAIGRGAKEPIASEAQEGLNRRVEIHIR
jgi:outer membrane protein OmpA-like peptidoglycan-associated protein